MFAKVDNVNVDTGDNTNNDINVDINVDIGGCGSLESIFARNSEKFAIRKMLMKSELQNGPF